MSHFYITYRLLFLSEKTYINPKYVVNKSLSGAGVKFQHIIGDNDKDGRHLARIEHDPAAIPQDIILESMSLYGAHLKTDEKALEFAKYISGDNTLTMGVNGNIEFPVIEDIN